MQKMDLIIRYLQFLARSKTKFGVHPPFLYHLITDVFEDKALYQDYLKIEGLKARQLKDQTMIQVTDLGAGSRIHPTINRSVSSIARNSSKSKKHGRLLFRLSQYLKPQTILELGTSLGYSSMYLALGNPDAQVISIEGCPNIAKLALENFKQNNLSRIQIINGNFDEMLPTTLDKIKQIDLAFIDGNHQKEPTLKYFEQCLSKSVNGTCFIFDDIHWSAGMEEAWNEIVNNKTVTLSVDFFFMGLVFIRKELSKQHFDIRF